MFVSDGLILFDEVGESRIIALAYRADELLITTETAVHHLPLDEPVWRDIVLFFREEDEGPGLYELRVEVEQAGEAPYIETFTTWLSCMQDAALAVERLPQTLERKVTLLSARRCNEATASG